ncbi:MAG: ferrous iron transporter B [Candidatus Aenigmarchaeota archaeon]|nr:ferrous iron transporter B [Candidatus Aenigmarchaeota archaeon]
MRRILLLGNPNVGKSVIFSRLTGTDVIVSNYPGTTVEYTKGSMKINGKEVEVIDVPGTYSLKPSNKAEEVAVKMLEELGKDAVVVNVVDSTNLERNLYLTLELMKKKFPMVVALNLWDETNKKGIHIDYKKLEKILGVPVVATVAITGEGIKDLVEKLKHASRGKLRFSEDWTWEKIGEIVSEVQRIEHRHPTWKEILETASVKPITGIPIAIIVLLLSFFFVRIIGEGLIDYVFDPLFEAYKPFVIRLDGMIKNEFLKKILMGEVFDGEISFEESLGLLTTGLYVPFAMVLPYVVAFYFVLGILEDTGYLPRLAVLLDNVFHKLGLHGSAIVPTLLGFGCNVPGALSTRILETRRQRFIALTLLSIAIPCIAQSSIIFVLVGRYGVWAIAKVYSILSIVWLSVGYLLNKLMKGSSPELFLEIPPYRFPYIPGLLKKLWIRIRWFLEDAIPYVMLGVLLVNFLYTFNVLSTVSRFFEPLISGWLGLPKESVVGIVMGFLRKDIAMSMLLPINMTEKQAIIASVILAMYFPCMATFVIVFKELCARDLIKMVFIMLLVSFLVGGFLNKIL